MTRARALVVVAVLSIGGGLAGCGGGTTVGGSWRDDGATPTGGGEPTAVVPDETPPTAVQTSVPNGDPEMAPTSSTGPVDDATSAVDSYQTAIAIANEAYADPAQGTTQLVDAYEDPALGRLAATLQQLESDGLRVRYRNGVPPVVSVLAVDLGDGVATLRVCVVDDALQVAVADGSTHNDDVVSSLRKISMRRTDDGTWKVVDDVAVEEWPDLDGCAR